MTLIPISFKCLAIGGTFSFSPNGKKNFKKIGAFSYKPVRGSGDGVIGNDDRVVYI